jgi:hypothetical protein
MNRNANQRIESADVPLFLGPAPGEHGPFGRPAFDGRRGFAGPPRRFGAFA